MTVIVTGAAGFIGQAVSRRLLDRGETVVGIDIFNSYYDPSLKEARAALLTDHPAFRLVRADIADAQQLEDLVRQSGARRMVHLAAQAGVRYSIENPFAYERSNLAGHLAVLEACRRAPGFEHLVYASSSSVYGERPANGGAFSEDEAAVSPVSLYAATKRAGELMSTAYASLYGTPQTGLRFFTVYGPWGRPDMAYFSFTQKILAGQPIKVFGMGEMARDFTYIDDIVDGVVGALMTMIEVLEKALGREATKQFMPMQPGDVTATFADIAKLSALTGYAPKVPIEQGLPRFVEWHRGHYGW